MGREQRIAVIIAVLAVVLGIRMAVQEKAEPVVAPFPGLPMQCILPVPRKPCLSRKFTSDSHPSDTD